MIDEKLLRRLREEYTAIAYSKVTRYFSLPIKTDTGFFHYVHDKEMGEWYLESPSDRLQRDINKFG